MTREKEKLLQERSRAESEELYCIAGIKGTVKKMYLKSYQRMLLSWSRKPKTEREKNSNCVDVNKFFTCFFVFLNYLLRVE